MQAFLYLFNLKCFLPTRVTCYYHSFTNSLLLLLLRINVCIFKAAITQVSLAYVFENFTLLSLGYSRNGSSNDSSIAPPRKPFIVPVIVEPGGDCDAKPIKTKFKFNVYAKSFEFGQSPLIPQTNFTILSSPNKFKAILAAQRADGFDHSFSPMLAPPPHVPTPSVSIESTFK